MIYVCICILALISVVAFVVCKPVVREEDRGQMLSPDFKLVSQSKPFMLMTWFIAALISIVLIVFRDDPDGLIPISMVGIVATGMCAAIGFLLRQNYYTDDGERLTRVKRLSVKWSLKWDKIDHVYRRLVTTGKSLAVFYDIVTTEGEVIKGLPSVTGRMLKKHKDLEMYHTVPFVPVLVFIILIIAALLLIFGD